MITISGHWLKIGNTICGHCLVGGLGLGLDQDLGQGDPSTWSYFIDQGFDEMCISTFLYALNIDICTNGYYGMIVPGNASSSSLGNC